MNPLSAAPCSAYPSPLSSPLPLPRRLLKASSLSSPKPRTKRPNRLRRKTLIPKPHPLQSPPPPPAPPLLSDEPCVVVLEEEIAAVERVVEEVHAAEVAEEAAAAVGVHPFAPAASAADLRSLPREVLGLALRFAVLIAVQTVVAVWFFGGVGGEEGNGSGERGVEEGRVGREVREVMELEKKVLEIRAMAKDARETERREFAEDSGVKGEVGKRLGRLRKSATKVILDENGFSLSLPESSKNMDQTMDGEKMNSKQKKGREKLNSKRKVGLLNSIKKAGNVPKGFNGKRSGDDRGNGGVEQIAQEAAQHHDPGYPRAHVSEMTQRLADIEDFAASSCEGTVERISSGHHLDGSQSGVGNNYMKDIEGISSSSETNSNSNINEVFLKTRTGESCTEVTRTCCIDAGKVNDESRCNLPTEQIEHTSFGNKSEDSHLDYINKPWWLKLPYVLAIVLRRGSDGNGPRGLYSLEMSSSVEENASSYTIAFQDRGDATNFCYLLESFFEDLGDVSADIVPLTIKELDQAVKSDTLKVVVVRKGQIHLYAGQPLVEVETAIRSLLD